MFSPRLRQTERHKVTKPHAVTSSGHWDKLLSDENTSRYTVICQPIHVHTVYIKKDQTYTHTCPEKIIIKRKRPNTTAFNFEVDSLTGVKVNQH